MLEKSQGADLPPLRNPPKMENTDDLTSLSYLNEPSGKGEKEDQGDVCVCVLVHVKG